MHSWGHTEGSPRCDGDGGVQHRSEAPELEPNDERPERRTPRGIAVSAERSPTRDRASGTTDAAEPRQSDYRATLTLPNRIESVRPAASFLVQTARALEVGAARAPLFDVAVTEVLTNAVKHGGRRGGEIRCEIELSASQLTLRVFDDGPGFSVPAQRPAEASPDSAEALRESGYG